MMRPGDADRTRARRLRHHLFKAAQWATRQVMVASLGRCIEHSYSGHGEWHQCVLWKGHMTAHRSATGALWSQGGRKIPPRTLRHPSER